MAFNLDSSPEIFVPNHDNEPKKLTQEQIIRIDKNRKRALEIKKSKENEAKMYQLTY